MKQEVKKKEMEVTRISDNYQESLVIELNIQDSIVLDYLNNFDESIRKDKALEALRIGVIAIQSASPALDTEIVKEKFKEVENNINTHINSFQGNIEKKLEEYFKADSGLVPRSLKTLFGENGQLTKLIQKQIGPSSEFAKSIDPSNKESVISKIEEIVNENLQENSNKIIKQFSLNNEDSALVRLKNSISSEVKEIQRSNNEFFATLREDLGIKIGKEVEAERGTEKGREFETILYNYVAKIGQQLGDSTENVTGIVGEVPRSKVGDYLITLGETSGAPGCNIVIEVKKKRDYRFKDAIKELEDAKNNRAALSGIFVFAKGFSPPEIGDFHFKDNDFFITVDEENIENKKLLLFFDAAYKIARTLIVSTAKKEEEEEKLDLVKIKYEINHIINLVSKLSELSKKADTIRKDSRDMRSIIDDLKHEMDTRFSYVQKLLNKTL